jgi:hypothetical protein
MSKADHSDTTRRRFLTSAAGAAATSAIPTATLTAAPAVDPIYAAIDAHRKVNAVSQAAWAESTRLYELADEKVGQDRKDAKEVARGYEDAVEEGPNAVAFRAQKEFYETVPTTLQGVLAMILYANELDGEDPEVFNDCQNALAAAAQALGGRVS